MRHITGELYTDVASIKIIVAEAEYCDAIVRGTEGVDRSRGEQVGVADGPGLGQVVQTTLSGVQNVFRETVGRGLIVGGCHVAAEDALLVANLIIHPAQHLVLVDLGNGAEAYASARIGGGGQKLNDI